MPKREMIEAIREIAAEKANGIHSIDGETDYYEGIENALSWVLGNCKCVIGESKLIFDYEKEN